MRRRSLSSDGALNVSWNDNVNFAGTSSVEEEDRDPLDTTGENSATLYTTEIVKAMFGNSVGIVVGDYSCYYKRASGRLYAATKSLCYYSNLFGSETKYIFRWGEVAEVSRTKSSGVSIKTKSGTEHTFRSFQDRDAVFQVILRLHSNDTPAPEPAPAPKISSTDLTAIRSQSDALTSEFEEASTRNALDRRLKSFSSFSDVPLSAASSLAKPFSEWKGKKSLPRRNRKKRRRMRSKSVDAVSSRVITDATESLSESSEEDSAEEAEVTLDLEKLWLAKKAKSDQNLREMALQGVHLSCDLETFYSTFLANDAPRCIGSFQKANGDFDLETSEWQKGEDEPAEKRTIRFRHPLKHKLGPSSAAMEKYQVCQRSGDHGICVKSCTYGKGFPAADCFHVEDLWLVEPCSNGGVDIAVRFQVNYTKSTMFKKLIDSNTRLEYKEMYQKYAKMAVSALGDEPEDLQPTKVVRLDADVTEPALAKYTRPDSFLLLLGMIAGILIIVLILFCYVMSLRGRISYLEVELQQMKDAMAVLQNGSK